MEVKMDKNTKLYIVAFFIILLYFLVTGSIISVFLNWLLIGVIKSAVTLLDGIVLSIILSYLRGYFYDEYVFVIRIDPTTNLSDLLFFVPKSKN